MAHRTRLQSARWGRAYTHRGTRQFKKSTGEEDDSVAKVNNEATAPVQEQH